MKEKYIKKDHLLSKQMIYEDHYISWTPGRLYHTNGKSDTSEMFSGGNFFVGNDSFYIIINHQVDIYSTETFKAKLAFKREAQSRGVVIKGYHTENGIFNTS